MITPNTVLAAIDKKDYGSRLILEHLSNWHPHLIVMLVWLRAVENYKHIIQWQETCVNCTYFKLAKHPKLVWQLLCTVSWYGYTVAQTGWTQKERQKHPRCKCKEVERLHPPCKK